MWRSVVVVMVACSSSSNPLCTPPPQTTYSCQPLSGSAGPGDCTGGPTWSPIRGGTDALRQDDPDKVFPERCNANIPDCSPFYRGSTRAFVCEGGGWSELL